MAEAVGFILAVALALLAHFPISWLVTRLYHGIGWRNEGASRRLPAIVGLIERSLFVTALLLGQPEFIGVWFALKVAGQWQGWIAGKPDNNPPIDGRDLFNVFLIGSGLSIAYSVFAVYLVRWVDVSDWGRVAIAVAAVLLAIIGLGIGIGKVLPSKVESSSKAGA